MNLSKPSIDSVWARLRTTEGEDFETKTGRPFTYEISGNIFHPSRTKYNIAKSDFDKILALVPLEGPGEVSSVVRGSAYIWAVLHDKRIRRNDW